MHAKLPHSEPLVVDAGNERAVLQLLLSLLHRHLLLLAGNGHLHLRIPRKNLNSAVSIVVFIIMAGTLAVILRDTVA